MSYSSVFLLILGLFAMIKNGASLKCYDSGYISCYENNDNPGSLEECLKNGQKENKRETCPSGAKVCLKVKLKGSGGEQFVMKSCGPSKSTCNDIQKQFQYIEAKSECDTCDSDYCNNTTLTAPISFGILIFSILVHFLF